MQQFTVPQFIDVEDKIIGPVTARQFLIMLSGFMLIVVCYKFFAFNVFLGASILIFAFSGIIAFFKINGMPFHFFILNFSQTAVRPPLRVWNHEYGKDSISDLEVQKTITYKEEARPKKAFSSSRLNELALIVDTQGSYRGEENGVRSGVAIRYNTRAGDANIEQ